MTHDQEMEIDRNSHSYLLGVAQYERNEALCALRRLVRKGTDGRYYTSQRGDADVTEIVRSILEREVV